MLDASERIWMFDVSGDVVAERAEPRHDGHSANEAIEMIVRAQRMTTLVVHVAARVPSTVIYKRTVING